MGEPLSISPSLYTYIYGYETVYLINCPKMMTVLLNIELLRDKQGILLRRGYVEDWDHCRN
jgi:hypothetical protein